MRLMLKKQTKSDANLRGTDDNEIENDMGESGKKGINQSIPNDEHVKEDSKNSAKVVIEEKLEHVKDDFVKKVTSENLTRKLLNKSVPNVEHYKCGENFKNLPQFKADNVL